MAKPNEIKKDITFSKYILENQVKAKNHRNKNQDASFSHVWGA
jgi:hypothetical protein